MDIDIFELAKIGSISKFRKELPNIIDINLQNKEGQTALMVAIENNHTALAQFINSKGGKIVNQVSEEDQNPHGTISKKESLDAILKEVNDLVGLDNIKQEIRALINLIKVNEIRKKEKLPQLSISLHSVFIGPPGTGKTTIARVLAKIYHLLGVLSSNSFVETDRAGLVAGYTGQTAIKSDEIINKATNGVLFIDEAYTLKRENTQDSFGQEAIDILLKRMEDYRDKIIVIVAGYENEMKVFLNSNPGLKSRFNRYLVFKDYKPSELTEIYLKMSEKSGFKITEEALKTVTNLFTILYDKRDSKFGNARLARNILEKTFQLHANRTSNITSISREILITIEKQDIPLNDYKNKLVC